MQTETDFFIAGKIISVQDQMLHIVDEDGIHRVVVITRNTRFWMGDVGASLTRVRPDQIIYAVGELEGNVLTARQAWINIVSIVGVVRKIRNDKYTIRNGNSEFKVRLRRTSEFFVGGERRATKGALANLRIGGQIHVIGLWDDDTLEVEATRIFLPRDHSNAPLPAKNE